MSETTNRVEVTILEERYVLKGEESEDYLEMLAFQINKKLQQVQNMNPRLSVVQTAILTAVNILDEYTKLQQEYQGLLELLDDPGVKSKK
ncbi:MAG: cell division protein ZapA [Actinobacteria bacterium]|nr:cell division protein ZapA [Actinomycetota bacterium]